VITCFFVFFVSRQDLTAPVELELSLSMLIVFFFTGHYNLILLMEVPQYKRTLMLLDASNIAHDMSFQCNYIPQCAETWTRKQMTAARFTFLSLKKSEQMLRVHDLMSAFRDPETKLLILKIGGKEIFHLLTLLQEDGHAGRHTVHITVSHITNFIMLYNVLIMILSPPASMEINYVTTIV
jgi:hypothetical protein